MSMREETPDNKEKRPVMETFSEEKVKKSTSQYLRRA